MAFGAAFMAANISTIFRVKPVHFYDGYEFDLQVLIHGLNQDDTFHKESILFPRKTRFGSKKSVAFKHDKDLQVKVNQLIGDDVVTLVTLNITNVTEVSESLRDNQNFSRPKISMVFKLGSMLPIEIENVVMTSEENKQVEVKQVNKITKDDNTTED